MITPSDLRPRDSAVLGADVVRVLGLVSVGVASAWLGFVGFALFALVLLGLVVPRAIAMRGPLDLTNGVLLLAVGWISAFDLYSTVGWLDVAVHLVANGMLAVLVHEFLGWLGAIPSTPGARAGARAGSRVGAGSRAGAAGRSTGTTADGVTDDAPPVRRPRLGIVVTTAAIGVLLAVLWEFGEWAGHTFVEDTISVGYEDTLGDLAAGGLGALLGGVLLARARHR